LKRISFIILIFCIILYLLLAPTRALEHSTNGIRLWFNTLLPALLPFMILSSLMISTSGAVLLINLLPHFFQTILGLSAWGIYAFFLGLFCGYPMGAKLTADLYREKKIAKNEAEYLLTISNNPGPSFVSGYLLQQLLNAGQLRAEAFLLLYTSEFICCLLFRALYGRFRRQSAPPPIKKEVSEVPLPELLDTSIMNSFEAITKLGGYILLFSLISGILELILPHSDTLSSLIMAGNELTSGSAKIAQLSWDFPMRFSVILGAASFGGISCIFQTSSMIRGTDLSLGMYALAKTVNGLLTFILCRLFFLFIL
jgi:sporulation integral membrane protein YlbJ